MYATPLYLRQLSLNCLGNWIKSQVFPKFLDNALAHL